MLTAIGLFAACLPQVGTLLPLRVPIRAPTGIVVQVFSVERNDAEFRGCDRDTCRVMLHPRALVDGVWRTRPFDTRGFGPVVELDRALFTRSIRLPECAAPIEAPAQPPAELPKPRRRPRVPKQARTPAPAPAPAPTSAAPPRPPTSADRIPFAPAPRVIIGRAFPPAPDVAPGLVAPSVESVVPEPVRPGRFVAPGGRVSGEIMPDGRVHFDPAPTATIEGGSPVPIPVSPWDPQPFAGVSARGEGLNALDGADLYAREKRLFLEQTAPERAAMRAARRRQALVDHRALHAACDAAMETMRGEARRTQLFQLWDEVDEQTPDAHASGRAARQYVEALIRARLPRRAGGYSLDELVRLNLCRAPPLFDPYADAELPARVADACPTP